MAGKTQPTGEVPSLSFILTTQPSSKEGKRYTMRESTCPRRRALVASTAAVLLLCGQPHVAEALITTGGGAPSALRMTTVASTRGSPSRGASGARMLGDSNIAGLRGNERLKSSGASSPLFSSGTSFAHRHNALVGAAAGSRQHADPSATRLHASMVRYACVHLCFTAQNYATDIHHQRSRSW